MIFGFHLYLLIRMLLEMGRPLLQVTRTITSSAKDSLKMVLGVWVLYLAMLRVFYTLLQKISLKKLTLLTLSVASPRIFPTE